MKAQANRPIGHGKLANTLLSIFGYGLGPRGFKGTAPTESYSKIIGATGCQVLKLKCNKIRFLLGLASTMT